MTRAHRRSAAVGIAGLTLFLALAFLPVGLAIVVGLVMVPIVMAVQ